MNKIMPTDCHKLDLRTQEDGSLEGMHTYYLESYHCFTGRLDGWNCDSIAFSSMQELIEHLSQQLATRYDAGVYIDGIKLENIRM